MIKSYNIILEKIHQNNSEYLIDSLKIDSNLELTDLDNYYIIIYGDEYDQQTTDLKKSVFQNYEHSIYKLYFKDKNKTQLLIYYISFREINLEKKYIILSNILAKISIEIYKRKQIMFLCENIYVNSEFKYKFKRLDNYKILNEIPNCLICLSKICCNELNLYGRYFNNSIDYENECRICNLISTCKTSKSKLSCSECVSIELKEYPSYLNDHIDKLGIDLFNIVYICLICGNTGCGRYKGAHSIKHSTTHHHYFSIDIENNSVFDYTLDKYIQPHLLNDTVSISDGLDEQTEIKLINKINEILPQLDKAYNDMIADKIIAQEQQNVELQSMNHYYTEENKRILQEIYKYEKSFKDKTLEIKSLKKKLSTIDMQIDLEKNIHYNESVNYEFNSYEEEYKYFDSLISSNMYSLDDHTIKEIKDYMQTLRSIIYYLKDQ